MTPHSNFYVGAENQTSVFMSLARSLLNEHSPQPYICHINIHLSRQKYKTQVLFLDYFELMKKKYSSVYLLRTFLASEDQQSIASDCYAM